MENSRYSITVCRDRGAWCFGVAREFAEFGVAVVAIGTLRVSLTWPVGDNRPGFSDECRRRARAIFNAFAVRAAGFSM